MTHTHIDSSFLTYVAQTSVRRPSSVSHDSRTAEQCEEDVWFMYWLVCVLGSTIFQHCFRSQWHRKIGSPWLDGEPAGAAFWAEEKNCAKKRWMEPVPQAIKGGNSRSWDLSVLSCVLSSNSSLRLLDDADHDILKQLKRWRNELAHCVGTERCREVGAQLGKCLGLVKQATVKHAPALLPDLETRVRRRQNRRFYLENPQELAGMLADLISACPAAVAACRCGQRERTRLGQLPAGLFAPMRVLPADWAGDEDGELARDLSEAVTPADSDSSDAFVPGDDSDGGDPDSDGVPPVSEGETVRVAVYASGAASQCAASLRLLEAYVAAHLGAEARHVLAATCPDGGRGAAELAAILNYVLDSQQAEEGGAGRTPVERILGQMVERGLET
jgi:hypothetical protein